MQKSSFLKTLVFVLLAFRLTIACRGENPAEQSKTLEFLRKLTLAQGAAGDEGEVRKILREKVEKFAQLSVDPKGALVARKSGSSASPVILLAAHMDEVGFQVRSITPEGFLKVVPLGNWYAPVVLGQRVVVKSSNGPIPGVFGAKPPHLLTQEEAARSVRISEMYIDIGARSADQVRRFGVQVGDHILPEGNFTRMADPNIIVAKAWDDRVGCALIAEVIEELSKQSHPNTVYGAWTTWEEMGRLNATVEMPELKPDLVIVVEVGITVDTPGVGADQVHERLGDGPSLDLYDGVLTTPPHLRNWVTGVARTAGIPLQYTTIWIEGAPSAAHTSSLLFRAPSIALLVPVRYAHTPNSVLDYRDYIRTRELLVHLIKSFDAETWRNISKE